MDLAGAGGQPMGMHPLHVAAHGFGALGHRAIDPCADLHRRSAGDVTCEAGRNLERQGYLSRPHAPFQIRRRRGWGHVR